MLASNANGTPAKERKSSRSKHYKNSIGSFIGFLTNDPDAKVSGDTSGKDRKSGLRNSDKKRDPKKSSGQGLERKSSNARVKFNDEGKAGRNLDEDLDKGCNRK